jgi:hypothetical protein
MQCLNVPLTQNRPLVLQKAQRYRNLPAVSSILVENKEGRWERATYDERKRSEENDRRLERLERIETEMIGLRRKVDAIAGKLLSFQSILTIVAVIYFAVSFLKGFAK